MRRLLSAAALELEVYCFLYPNSLTAVLVSEFAMILHLEQGGGA